MVLQGLAPGMEHGGHAELSAEMLGIGRNGGERLCRAAEQDGIDDRLVMEGNLSGGRRQGEDDVEIRHRRSSVCRSASHCARAAPCHFGQCRLRVVGDVRSAAVVALLDMAAEHRRPTRGDGAHRAALDAAEVTGMRLSKRLRRGGGIRPPPPKPDP